MYISAWSREHGNLRKHIDDFLLSKSINTNEKEKTYTSLCLATINEKFTIEELNEALYCIIYTNHRDYVDCIRYVKIVESILKCNPNYWNNVKLGEMITALITYSYGNESSHTIFNNLLKIVIDLFTIPFKYVENKKLILKGLYNNYENFNRIFEVLLRNIYVTAFINQDKELSLIKEMHIPLTLTEYLSNIFQNYFQY